MNNKKGSVVLETAITFTVALVFICSIISVTVFMRTDILMQRSVDQACEQTSLIPPVSIPLSDALSTLINAFPDMKISSSKGSDVIKKVASAVGGIDLYSGNSIANLILEGTLAHSIANKVRSGYIERNGGSDFFVPEMIDVDIRLNTPRHIMEVTCTYQVLTIAGKVERKIFSAIPVYGGFGLALNPSVREDEDYDIWSEDNFTRGDFFRDETDSNLPKTFPVIDSYYNGTAGSTLSIDLTSPYYASERRVTGALKEEIDKLAVFDGADVIINKKRYVVESGSITDRVLTVIIPGNSDETARARLESMSGYADSRGVTLNVVEYGTSQRYK